ncbi:hypothetical protein [Shewanella litoralis]|uniref:Anti-sigma factor n=1 Tax=Shewanella litoralis TaxID=2282700 RepID=A0ABQ2RD12_9GAMM|nr:hypothetical protein [Shewanella litoralis]GGQ24881.1 anti-sigma factor [Shewanella litoralis]
MSEKKHDLDHLIATLPPKIAPTTDLWDGIKPHLTSKLTPQKALYKNAVRPLWAIAATFLVCSLLWLTQWRDEPVLPQEQTLSQMQAAKITTVAIDTSASVEVDNHLIELINQIAQTHQSQLNGFIRNQYTVSWQLSADNNKHIQTDIAKALIELENASNQVQAALAQQPTNQQLWQLWRWIMQRQITLLQQGQELPFTHTRPAQGNTL